MRAMRINTKKKECVNAPIGPFTIFSHCVYGYNVRSELISSRREAKVLEYQYQCDAWGNVVDDETRHGVNSDKEAEWEKKYDVH
jgi:hypothetical protein